MACLCAGCFTACVHTPIVGQWEHDEMSSDSDLGHVHTTWEFLANGQVAWSASILDGKETMSDRGTYAATVTNLVVHLVKWGSHSYVVENLSENALRLSDDGPAFELKRRKLSQPTGSRDGVSAAPEK